MPVEMVDPLAPLVPLERQPCRCGRSATGLCTGLHAMTEQEWNHMLMFDMGMDVVCKQGDTHETPGNDGDAGSDVHTNLGRR